MGRRFIALGTCVLGLGMLATAVADPVDNDGDAVFYNSTGAYPFLEFASTEVIQGSTESFEAYADTTGDIYFNSSSMPFTLTAQDLGGDGGRRSRCNSSSSM